MNRTLPFDMEVECIAYHNRAFELGIIKANLSEYRKWLPQKLINCLYTLREGYPLFEIIEDDMWELQQGLAERQTIYVNTAAFKQGYIAVLDLIQYMLRTGHYVIGFYNEFYIPGKKAYKTYNFWHDYVLFGYDDEKKLFASAGYLAGGKYEKFEIKYDDFLDSIYNIGTDNVDIWFYKINSCYKVEFRIESILHNIGNYLNSKHESGIYRDSQNTYYGISAWDIYAKYVIDANTEALDLRFSRVFMEHKMLMLNRIQICIEEGCINDQSLLTEYKREIVDQAKAVHYLCLKCAKKSTLSAKTKMYDLINSINSKEVDILNHVIKLIQ